MIRSIVFWNEPYGLEEGDAVLFLGETRELALAPDAACVHLSMDGARIVAPAAKETLLTQAVATFFARELLALIRRCAEHRAASHDFPYRKIALTRAQGRWGSCSAKNALNFSLMLAGAPVETIDYVVVHELVHTRIKNHSPAFWMHVGSIMPDYKTHKRTLRTLATRRFSPRTTR